MSETENSLRVLISKVGLDGHDRGAKVIARAIREAEIPVSYTGIRLTPEQIAVRAEEFGANVIGVSILSGSHLELMPQVVKFLKEREMIPNENVTLLMGGIIPEVDEEALLEMGVAKIFRPGTPTGEIVSYIENNPLKTKS